VPAGSRGAAAGPGWRSFLREGLHRSRRRTPPWLTQLAPIAAELGCSLAQLAIAWVAKNPRVSTVITGLPRGSDQLRGNLGALARWSTG
jgi:aryl-alcohol dehydrogenase-like predicted oxidoreductase